MSTILNKCLNELKYQHDHAALLLKVSDHIDFESEAPLTDQENKSIMLKQVYTVMLCLIGMVNFILIASVVGIVFNNPVGTTVGDLTPSEYMIILATLVSFLPWFYCKRVLGSFAEIVVSLAIFNRFGELHDDTKKARDSLKNYHADKEKVFYYMNIYRDRGGRAIGNIENAFRESLKYPHVTTLQLTVDKHTDTILYEEIGYLSKESEDNLPVFKPY